MYKEDSNKIDKFKEWTKLNADKLPISAPFWEVEIIEKLNGQYSETIPELISLGRYNAEVVHSTPFYKPFTKIFKI
ncbi:hypothetical protein D3C87_129990 [compost metagenome]